MNKTMKLGRELDALVAEKVMGLVYRPLWLNSYQAPVPHAVFSKDVKQNDHTVSLLKPYSTDIAAAWEVVEKLKENYDVLVHLKTGHEVLVFKNKQHKILAESRSEESTPHAICLAALKAVEWKSSI